MGNEITTSIQAGLEKGLDGEGNPYNKTLVQVLSKNVGTKLLNPNIERCSRQGMTAKGCNEDGAPECQDFCYDLCSIGLAPLLRSIAMTLANNKKQQISLKYPKDVFKLELGTRVLKTNIATVLIEISGFSVDDKTNEFDPVNLKLEYDKSLGGFKTDGKQPLIIKTDALDDYICRQLVTLTNQHVNIDLVLNTDKLLPNETNCEIKFNDNRKWYKANARRDFIGTLNINQLFRINYKNPFE